MISYMLFALCGFFLSAAIFGTLGTWVAKQCGRADNEGLFLGMLLGPLGVLIVAMLPRK